MPKKTNQVLPVATDAFAKRASEELEWSQVFEFRMLIEGTIFDYYDTVKQMTKERDNLPLEERKKSTSVKRAAAKKFGYVSASTEIQWYLDWVQRLHKDETKEREAARRREERRREKIRKAMYQFAEAIKDLPPTADPDAETDWIACHPKMSRQVAGQEVATTDLCAEDISSTIVPCPSQRAANMLGSWVQHPHDFFIKHLPKTTVKAKDSPSEDIGDRERRQTTKRTVAKIREMLATLQDSPA